MVDLRFMEGGAVRGEGSISMALSGVDGGVVMAGNEIGDDKVKLQGLVILDLL